MKPLHVRVAEALGWTEISPGDFWGETGGWQTRWRDGVPVSVGLPEHAKQMPEGFSHGRSTVPRYDTDWSATGLLIEKYRIAMWTAGPVGELLGDGHDRWRCNSDDNGLQLEGSQVGPTPLIAVCNLILALHEAGKLPK